MEKRKDSDTEYVFWGGTGFLVLIALIPVFVFAATHANPIVLDTATAAMAAATGSPPL
jgi:hypothetical protein